MSKILITSSLPYVNGSIHLGNIAGSHLPADVMARYYRLQNQSVVFISGSDDYGTTSMLKAIEENCSPYELCNKYRQKQIAANKWFNISFDHYGQTSCENPRDNSWIHTRISSYLFTKLVDSKYVFEQTVQQLYCTKLQSFVADRFITGTCYLCGYEKAKGDQCDQCCELLDGCQLINPICSQNGNPLIIANSDHLFLDLPKLTSKLTHWYTTVKSSWDKNSQIITEKWLQDLQPRCITRDLTWGSPVPNTNLFGNKYQHKAIYPWIDALMGYISLTENRSDLWHDPNTKIIQFFSKDNIPFHTILLPAILLAIEDPIYNKVSQVASCHYLLYQNQKFSKSEKIGIFADMLPGLNIHVDYWRYYLLKIRPETSDSSFNLHEFVDVCNSDLVNKFGNYVNRLLSLTKKHNHIQVLTCFHLQELHHNYDIAMSHVHLRQALKYCLDALDIANKYLQDEAPWKLTDNSVNVISTGLYLLSEILSMLEPFIPESCHKIRSYFTITNNYYTFYLDNYTLPFTKLNYDNLVTLLLKNY